MLTIIAFVLLALLMLAGFAFLFYVINQRLNALRDDSGLGFIKQDLENMNQTMSQTQAHMNDRLDNAARVFSGLTSELGKMQEIGRSMKDIGDVLKSPKLRGNIGEQMMSDLISQQIPKSSYTMQYAFRSGEKVDAVIKTRNGLIPVDSKFPVENFLKFTNAESEDAKNMSEKVFVSDVKKHINAIAKKYILPSEGTVDFALMYVPGEAVYYHIMTATDLADFASSSRVYLVSPHSFYYFLQTILLSLEGEMIEQKAKEVMNYLKSIQVDSRKFGDELNLVNKHLTNAKSAVDNASNSFTKLGSKIETANTLSSERSKSIPETNPLLEEASSAKVDDIY